MVQKEIKRIVNNNLVQKLLFLILLMLLWELVAKANIFPATLFPAFSTILLTFINGLIEGTLLSKVLYSLNLIIKGLFLSFLIAIILSFLAIISVPAKNMVEVLNSVLHPLPGIALLPIAILWFGISEASILFIILHSVIWPLVVNFITGFKSIPRIHIELGYNFGLKGLSMLWHIMLPSSLPFLISGFKIGWARAWRAVIAAEMVFGAAAGTAGGLGWHIYMTRYYFDIAGTFAALLAIIIVGIIVEELIFNLIEKHTVKKWGMSI